MKVVNLVLSIVSAGLIFYIILTRTYNDNNCDVYQDKIEKLESRIEEDSITMTGILEDAAIIWEENQIFSSMLSQIESEPGGSSIINKLWIENQNKDD
jgi:hypothetical protein